MASLLNGKVDRFLSKNTSCFDIMATTSGPSGLEPSRLANSLDDGETVHKNNMREQRNMQAGDLVSCIDA